jgi:diguanylate cyclase (GGDEF)-like protein
MQNALAQSNDDRRWQRLFDEGPLAGWVLDRSGSVLAMNQAAERDCGYGAAELLGKNLREALRASDNAGVLRCTRKDGTPLLLALRQRDVAFEGDQATLLLASVPDSADPLTGLASRSSFLQRLHDVFERRGPSITALLLIDVDRFRRINNSAGTGAGDALLAQVAERVRSAAPQGALAARLAADEFTVLLENVRDPGQALRAAERLHAALRQPFTIGPIEVITTVSIGVAFSGQSCATPNDLLRNADTAMGRARLRGPGRTVLWDSSMAGPTSSRLELESELRRALDNGEMHVGYQPIIDLSTGEITGFEALARWNHPVRGPMAAGAFVQVAEESGLIEKMGMLILRDACRHMRSLELGRRVPLTLSVNLSARQLLKPDLADEIAQALADTGFHASRLRVEVTESVLVENREAAASLLRRLRDLKIRVFLDDFGTGYSSLSYLHDLPVDGLKIDRSFVEALKSGERAKALVRSILGLARGLSLDVVVEGVETEEQAHTMHELECASAQGFLFAKAVNAEQARALIQRGPFFWR